MTSKDLNTVIETHFSFLKSDPSFLLKDQKERELTVGYKHLWFRMAEDRTEFYVFVSTSEHPDLEFDLSQVMFWAQRNDLADKQLPLKSTKGWASKVLKTYLPLIEDLFSPEKYEETKKSLQAF